MDALTLLKEDHRTVEALFKKFEALGDKALKAKRKLVDQMVKELSMHAVIEEQVFYPAVRERVGALEDEVLEALEEHHVAKWLLSELDGLPADAERFDAKVSVLMENVRHHVKEEEKTLFPQVKRALKPADLKALGELLQAGDVLVDGGNSRYTDDQVHAAMLAEKGVGYVDAGVSGGVWGLQNGYALMVGGDADNVAKVQPAFDTLKPSEGGFVHAGKVGAGHFSKMVHNGIEYGIMLRNTSGTSVTRSDVSSSS